jgi:hypothetical protein
VDYVINTGDIVYYLRNSDLVGVVTNIYFSGDGTFRKIPYATVSWFTDIQLPKNLSVLSLTRITKAEILNDW